MRTFDARLQKLVLDSMQSVGGYPSPTAAATELHKGIGKIVVTANASGLTPNGALDEELARAVITSTCLANQYCVNLAHESRVRSSHTAGGIVADQMADVIPSVSAICGRISQIVDTLEGTTPIEKDGEVEPIGPQIAHLHQVLLEISPDLPACVLKALETYSVVGDERFQPLFDPSVAPCLNRFSRIQENTHCLFAPVARLWGASEWTENESVCENLTRYLPEFWRFARVAPHESLDGFVLELKGNHGNDVQELGRTLNQCLRFLASHDPSGFDCMQLRVDDPAWQFQFGGIRTFIITFAPCYPKSSSRFSFDSTHTYFFFQPETSFEGFKISRGVDKEVRSRIRLAFAKHGRAYDTGIVRGALEAPRYVKPLKVEDETIRWWEL